MNNINYFEFTEQLKTYLSKQILLKKPKRKFSVEDAFLYSDNFDVSIGGIVCVGALYYLVNENGYIISDGYKSINPICTRFLTSQEFNDVQLMNKSILKNEKVNLKQYSSDFLKIYTIPSTNSTEFNVKNEDGYCGIIDNKGKLLVPLLEKHIGLSHAENCIELYNKALKNGTVDALPHIINSEEELNHLVENSEKMKKLIEKLLTKNEE